MGEKPFGSTSWTVRFSVRRDKLFVLIVFVYIFEDRSGNECRGRLVQVGVVDIMLKLVVSERVYMCFIHSLEEVEWMGMCGGLIMYCFHDKLKSTFVSLVQFLF